LSVRATFAAAHGGPIPLALPSTINEHYSQLDSQMILAVTTAVVAYARTVKPEDLK
jgi:hypothetical protein